MNIDFSNKVAFVTGGSKGIGKAIAQTLAQSGANVAIMSRGIEDLKKVEESINNQGNGRALSIQGDVSNPEDMKEAVRQTVEEFGNLHLAVNNAAISGEFGLLHESTIENWKNVLSINLDGVFYAMKYEIAEMIKAGEGAIVNIASVEAHSILNLNPAYTTAKHGLLGLTKTAARDYADQNIRINTVSPGVIQTPMSEGLGEDMLEEWEEMIPVKRLGDPQEVANTVAFVLSDLSSYTTATDVVVDGAFLYRSEQ